MGKGSLGNALALGFIVCPIVAWPSAILCTADGDCRTIWGFFDPVAWPLLSSFMMFHGRFRGHPSGRAWFIIGLGLTCLVSWAILQLVVGPVNYWSTIAGIEGSGHENLGGDSVRRIAGLVLLGLGMGLWWIVRDQDAGTINSKDRSRSENEVLDDFDDSDGDREVGIGAKSLTGPTRARETDQARNQDQDRGA